MATFAQPPTPSVARESGVVDGARGHRISRLRSAAAARGAAALDGLLAAAASTPRPRSRRS